MVDFSTIDKKDIAILQALDQDVRASYTQIGKQTGLSKEVVHYRIKRLEKKNILTGSWATPTIGADKAIYKVLIKNKSLGKENKQQFITYVKSLKEAVWFAGTEGNWDFVMTFFVKQHEEFAKAFLRIMERFGTYFSKKHILKSTSMIAMNEKYLHDDNTTNIKEDSFLEPKNRPDKKNQQIINMLSEDARISFSDIGRAIGLTPEAVSKRYRAILDRKLLVRSNIRINQAKLDLSYYHIFISVSDYEKKDAISTFYTQHPSCVFMMKHIGYYDLHLEIVVKEEEIERIIEELTEKFGEAISSYELLKIRKEHIMIVTR